MNTFMGIRDITFGMKNFASLVMRKMQIKTKSSVIYNHQNC